MLTDNQQAFAQLIAHFKKRNDEYVLKMLIEGGADALYYIQVATDDGRLLNFEKATCSEIMNVAEFLSYGQNPYGGKPLEWLRTHITDKEELGYPSFDKQPNAIIGFLKRQENS